MRYGADRCRRPHHGTSRRSVRRSSSNGTPVWHGMGAGRETGFRAAGHGSRSLSSVHRASGNGDRERGQPCRTAASLSRFVVPPTSPSADERDLHDARSTDSSPGGWRLRALRAGRRAPQLGRT